MVEIADVQGEEGVVSRMLAECAGGNVSPGYLHRDKLEH